MTSELDDLKEFNNSLSTYDHNHTPKRVRGSRHDEPTEETTLCDDSSVSKDKFNSQMWAVYGDRLYSACEKAVDSLRPGQYVVDVSQELGIHFRKTDTNLDDLVELPDSVSEQVINEIEAFWTKEERFRQYGFLWKRGVLMWGPPGGGKTSTLQVISQRIVNHGGISLYVTDPGLTARGLAILRRVEPKRPIVVMIEDIDAVVERYGEPDLLALMDGELQIDNVVFIATTNYPENLDRRFINRPSRFDVVKKIGMPKEAARRVYLGLKNPRLLESEVEMKQWVALTDGFSIAHIKELIVSVEVFEVSLDMATERLKQMMNAAPSSGEKEGSFGFT